MNLTEWLYGFAVHFGYIGVFFISLVGALSIIIPIPYTLVIYLLGGFLNPILIAVAGGAGSALGELSGYVLGYYGRKLVSEERKRKMDYITKIFRRYGSIVIFIFALTPLPDDLLFIPLGILKYPLLKIFIPALAGKFMMNLILAYGGRLSIGLIREFMGEEGLTGVVITGALLALVIIIILKTDWEKVFEERFLKTESLT
ncbi:VTT domain-containing protein [Candidatus Bathyarchaeota archaeon]|nr:VTT domain-containing protein [Candidatus Bathyarchaeota archaeon]